MTDWDESTQSPFLKGVDMPAAGHEVALVRVEEIELPDRDAPQGSGRMKPEFVAHWRDSDPVKPYVMNKTARKYLRDNCGITNANVSAFNPIPLRLVQTPKQGTFAEGVAFMVRNWRPEELTAQLATGNRPPQPTDRAEPPPLPQDDVPF